MLVSVSIYPSVADEINIASETNKKNTATLAYFCLMSRMISSKCVNVSSKLCLLYFSTR